MLILNGTTPRIPVLMVDATDDETAETGLTVTCQVSKDGGAFTTTTNSPVEVANGWYYVALTATETNTDGPLLVRATGAGADEWRDYHQVYTAVGANVTTNNDKAGYSLANNAITAAVIATDAIGGDALATTAITEIQSGLATAAGVSAVETDTQDIQSRLPSVLVSGRIDSSVGAMAANTLTASALATDAATEIQSGLSTLDAAGVRSAVGLASANLDTQLTAIDDFLDTEVAAIKAKTDNLPASPAAVGSAMTLTSGERDSIATALLDLSGGIETGLTPRQALRLMAAALAGKLSGAATTTIVIRNAVADSKARITATVDADGNRTAITTDLT